MRPTDYVEIFAFIVEACGLVFLFLETRRAQKGEERERQKSAEELEELDKSRSDLKDTSDARHAFRKILADWLQKDGMGPDEAAIMARRVLGLNQSAPRLILPAWLDINYVAPRLLKHRALLLTAGTALLILAVMIHAILFGLETRKPEQPTPAPVRTHVTPISSGVIFDPGQALLKYSIAGRVVDLTPAACRMKKALAAAGTENVFVIGHHDRTHLKNAAREAFSSNEGLAQRRADEVGKYLTEDNPCGPGIQNAVVLIGGPRLTARRTGPQPNLGADRTVEVWAIAP